MDAFSSKAPAGDGNAIGVSMGGSARTKRASNASSPDRLHAALAAHRFGLGEATLADIAGDGHDWLLAQIGPAEAQRGSGLVSGAEGLRRYVEAQQQQRLRQAAGASAPASELPAVAAMPAGSSPRPSALAQLPDMGAAAMAAPAAAPDPLRALVQADQRARLATAALSARPFNERLALFWANHFTVSLAKGSVRGTVGAFEREAIRPHIAGSFQALLQAAVTHVAMLRYLDNDNSASPDSPVVRRLARRARADGSPSPRVAGLNENLAREVLELHTLGVAGGGSAYGGWGGYTQADVTEVARVLTGWRAPLRALAAEDMRAAPDAGSDRPDATRFDANWHDPGGKTVLGTPYPAGADALPALLAALAQHPSTARFVSAKLARHFVADDPPAALVARLEATWRKTGGDLPSVYRTLLQSPEAWAPQPAKLKTPEEFVISTARLLRLGDQAFARQPDGGAGQLGQRVQAAPSPAGWPDRAEEWLGPDAVWKRVEWATRVADRLGRQHDARALAMASLGPLLHDDTARQIERAADGPQALALLLMSPEFQRR